MKNEHSKSYRKYRIGKQTCKTHIIAGSGNAKGSLVVGAVEALQKIEQYIGRKLNVVKTDHTKHQWVFCEAKGTPRSPKFPKK